MNSLLVGSVARAVRHKNDTFELMGSSMIAVHKAARSATRSSGKLDHISCDGVGLHTQKYGDATIIGAIGELDASNIHHLTNHAHRSLSTRRAVVLDLSQLDFLAAQGIMCLFDIADECARVGVEWALVPGHAVLRLLRICDQDARLPVVSSVDEAAQRFSARRRPRGLLQLVTKSG